MTRLNPTPENEDVLVNWSAYICGGGHCKCMNLDGTCKNYHNGDHTCPASTSAQPEAQERGCAICNINFADPDKLLVHLAGHKIERTHSPVQAEPQAQDGAQVEGAAYRVLRTVAERHPALNGIRDEFKDRRAVLPPQCPTCLARWQSITDDLLTCMKYEFDTLIATATREAYERCLEAVGEDESTDFEHVQYRIKPAIRNQLRAEIRQRLAERGNDGRGGKS